MASYDEQAANLQRQQMIADALRQSGNQAAQYAPPSGDRAYRHSPLEGINKILQQVLGAYQSSQVEKQKADLGAQDKANTAQVTSGLTQNVDDGLRAIVPAVPQANLEAAAGNANDPLHPNAAQNALGTAQDAMSQNQGIVDQNLTDTKAARMAAALRGAQFGGSAGPLAEAYIQRQALPKEKADYSTNPGEIRWDGETNKPIAMGGRKQYKPDAEDRTLINIEDGRGGFRTIARKDWNGEKQYVKPEKAAIDPNAVVNMTDGDKSLIQAIYKGEKAPLPMTGRSGGYNRQIMEGVVQMGRDEGNPYNEFEYAGRMKANNAFNTGKQGQTVRSFNVMIDHLHTLEDEFKKLDNGDVQVVNKWKNWTQKQFGAAAPTTVEALKSNIRGELVKAITGGPGAESDRKEALDQLGMASSPSQITDALKGIRALAGGQLAGLGREYEQTTHFGQDRFKKFLSPAARQIYESLPEDTGNPNAAPSAAAPAVAPTKTIGGVTYTKNAKGEWEQQ